MNQQVKTVGISEIENQIELTSFTQNLAHLNSFVLQLQKELLSSEPNDKRIAHFIDEATALQGTLVTQLVRVLAISGHDAPNVKYLDQLLIKLDYVRDLAIDRIRSLEAKRDKLTEDYHGELRRLDERRDTIAAWLAEGNNAERFSKAFSKSPPSLDEIEKFMAQDAGQPPDGPVDNGGSGAEDEEMEKRIANLESFANDARERLVRIETRLDGIDMRLNGIESKMATKADIAALATKTDIAGMATKTDIAEVRVEIHKMDSSIKTWMIVTVVGLFLGFGGMIFTLGNFLKPLSTASISQNGEIGVQLPKAHQPSQQPPPATK